MTKDRLKSCISAPQEAHFELFNPNVLRAHPCPVGPEDRTGVTTLYGGDLKEFETPRDIISRLPIPTIEFIFSNLCKSCPYGIILQVTDYKILFNDVSDFGDFIIPFDFIFSLPG